MIEERREGGEEQGKGQEWRRRREERRLIHQTLPPTHQGTTLTLSQNTLTARSPDDIIWHRLRLFN